MSKQKSSQQPKPASVRLAKKAGWHTVSVTHEQYRKHGMSFLGLCIHCDSFAKGQWINHYRAGINCHSEFAFEQAGDAAWFIMQFT